MGSAHWSPVDALKSYARVLGRKMGFVALAWVGVYFLSQPCRGDKELNVLMLFGPMLGSLAGLVAGWYLATDAVEDSNLHGLVLWVLLVIGAVAPMWIVEGIMHLVIPASWHWQMGFGGYMVLMSATLLAMAAAVWHATSQE